MNVPFVWPQETALRYSPRQAVPVRKEGRSVLLPLVCLEMPKAVSHYSMLMAAMF